MSPTRKKIIIIILFFITAAAIALALYWFFFRTTTGQKLIGVSLPPPPTTTAQLPAAGQRAATGTIGIGAGVRPLPSAAGVPVPSPAYYKPVPVTQIVSDYALNPSVNKNGDLRYYNGSDGKFYRRLADGTVTPMSDQVFYNAQTVTWGNKEDKAIIEYPDSNKILYNFDTKQQVTLFKHWQDFSFSSDDNQIAAKSMGLSPENRWLITFADNGTNSQIIEPLGDNADKVKVDWSPSRQTVALAQTADPIGGERRAILLVGQNHENFKALTTEGFGFRSQWSPSGQRILYSVYSSRTNFLPELWISNSYGDLIDTGRQSIKLYTWADRCAFASEQIVYCAVPRDLPKGAGLMPEIAADSATDLVKVDLSTNLKTQIGMGDNPYHIDKLFYDKITNKVMFTDKTQTGVFEVNL